MAEASTINQENGDLAAKILKQVEFYFSDSNLPRDKYLKNIASQNEGWVPIETIATFKRMQQLTSDKEVITEAILQSKGFLEVSDDRKYVKRIPPIPEDLDTNTRTVYVKGFPLESTLDQLQEYFNPSGALAVRMRRILDTKAFKGSVFVEFPTPEDAEKYAAEQHQYKDTTLTVMMKNAYTQMKKEEYEAKKARRAAKQGREKEAEEDEKEEVIPEDCIVHFENVGDECSRELLKEIFGEFGKVVYVDFSRGEKFGKVRFDGGGAKKAVEELTKKEATIAGVKPTLRALEGEENTAYWVQIKDRKDASRKRKSGGSKQSNRRQRRGKGRDDKDGEGEDA